MKSKIIGYFNLFFGLLICAFAFNLFLGNYNIVQGGISGLSIVVCKVFSINKSLFMLSVNIVLIIISWFLLGKEFTKKTIVGAILFPMLIEITSFLPAYINIKGTEKIIIAAVGGLMMGYGYGLNYKSGYTSGGSDIINFILSKYLHIPIDTSILIGDGLIVLTGVFVFGLESLIYSIVALVCISFMSNKIMLGINSKKTLYIISAKYNEIKNILINKHEYDITLFDYQSGKLNKDSKLIMVIIHNKDYFSIKNDISKIDKKAFITITNSYECINDDISITKSKKNV